MSRIVISYINIPSSQTYRSCLQIHVYITQIGLTATETFLHSYVHNGHEAMCSTILKV
jgi:hypothetical protein